MSDGAAAVLLTTETVALARGLSIQGVWLAYATVGLEPAVMGMGMQTHTTYVHSCVMWGNQQWGKYDAKHCIAYVSKLCVRHAGPALAIPKALRVAGLSISDIDVFEINEVCDSSAQ